MFTKKSVKCLSQRGESLQTNGIRQFLHEYYSMVQNPGETVSQFSHRFMDVQYALEKLVPGIHYLNDKSDLELRLTFIIKLQPTIQK